VRSTAWISWPCFGGNITNTTPKQMSRALPRVAFKKPTLVCCTTIDSTLMKFGQAAYLGYVQCKKLYTSAHSVQGTVLNSVSASPKARAFWRSGW
jgi:hypothetical protein